MVLLSGHCHSFQEETKMASALRFTCSGSNTDCMFSEPLKTSVILCYQLDFSLSSSVLLYEIIPVSS